MKTHPFLLIALLVAVSSSIVITAPESQADVQQPDLQQQVAERQVSLDLKDVPVKEAVDALFNGSGHHYAVTPDVSGTITIKLADVPFSNALGTLANIAGLQVSKQNGVFVLAPDPNGPGLRAAVSASAPGGLPPELANIQQMPQQAPGIVNIRPTARPGAKTFDVVLDQANLVEAVKQLLEMAGKDYILDMGVSPYLIGAFGTRVTARMRNATLDSALEVLSRTSGLEVDSTGPAYVIRVKPGQGYSGPVGPPPPTMKGGVPSYGPTSVCPGCGSVLDMAWRFCPWCGQQQNPKAGPTKGTLKAPERPVLIPHK